MRALPVDDDLKLLQRVFAESIFFDDAAIPATVRDGSGRAYASRFSVYRNNVFASLIGAIAARYPVVRKLLWEETFDQIARCYVTAEPPRSPVLHQYGDSFPQFLRSIGQSASANCVADVAELEAARIRAYHSADAATISREVFRALLPDRILDLRLALHPSVQLRKSCFPIVSIWEANQQANDNPLTFWKAECALIARPRSQVEVWHLPLGVHEFLSALMDRCTIGEAVSRAMSNTPSFDLTECFGVLLSADVVVALQPAPCGHSCSAIDDTGTESLLGSLGVIQTSDGAAG